MGQGQPTDASGRLRPGQHAQFVDRASLLGHTLPVGMRLGDFEITGLIGEGGFGIVYLAYDEVLQRELAIKEYMPSSLAARAAGSHTVTVKSERHRETFEAGLRSFVNEARLLAQFDHPSLLKVYRFWNANGTAYMAMPFYEGRTLKQELAALRAPPSEEQLRAWLAPLLDALDVMHEAHCFHRDIAPDNILLTRDGPLLLDFGAARRVIGDMTHALTVVLKPGYAPVEQYGDSPGMTQGAWTDLYALACVVYYAITGKSPLSSVERMMDSNAMPPLSRIAAGRYSEGFLRAIDATLAILPRDRPQSVAQFRALLDAQRPASAEPRAPTPKAVSLPPAARPPPLDEASTIIPGRRRSASASGVAVAAPATRSSAGRRAAILWSAALGGLVLLAAGAAVLLAELGSQPSPPALASPPAQVEPARVVAPVAPVAPVAAVHAAASAAAPAATGFGTPAAAPVFEPTPTATAPTLTSSPSATAPTLTSSPTATAPTLASGTAAPDTAAAPADMVALDPPAATRKPEATVVARRPPRPAAAAPEPPMTKALPARCSDILQKASLEPLTPEEGAFLRRDCR